MKTTLYLANRAYESLRMIFDPAVEGNPYKINEVSRRRGKPTRKTTPFFSRRGMMVGF